MFTFFTSNLETLSNIKLLRKNQEFTPRKIVLWKLFTLCLPNQNTTVMKINLNYGFLIKWYC